MQIVNESVASATEATAIAARWLVAVDRTTHPDSLLV
jgi:hypothetical protein